LKGRLLKFYKFEGAGNDFIIIDGRFEKLTNPLEIAKKLLDRHYSVGADTLLYLEESSIATIKMRVLEKDGSESSMCGNGARCVGLYFDKFFNIKNISIETLSNVKYVNKINENIFEVNMGRILPLGTFFSNKVDSEITKINILNFEVFLINSSEPHAVIFTENIERIPKNKAIKVAKNRNLFPFGINVNFVKVEDSNTIKIRTIERGIFEETLACGTGAVASAYVFHKIKNGADEVNVKARGGNLKVNIKKDGNYLIGPARFVFKGEIEI